MPARIRSIARQMLGGDHRGGEVELHAAIPLGCQDGGQSELGRFLQDGDGGVMITVVDGVEMRGDVVGPEFVGGPGDTGNVKAASVCPRTLTSRSS